MTNARPRCERRRTTHLWLNFSLLSSQSCACQRLRGINHDWNGRSCKKAQTWGRISPLLLALIRTIEIKTKNPNSYEESSNLTVWILRFLLQLLPVHSSWVQRGEGGVLEYLSPVHSITGNGAQARPGPHPLPVFADV